MIALLIRNSIARSEPLPCGALKVVSFSSKNLTVLNSVKGSIHAILLLDFLYTILSRIRATKKNALRTMQTEKRRPPDVFTHQVAPRDLVGS